ncbi:MAG: hypothetical protein E6Q97_24040 [Desulfurellales bacterium]|mgnify:CR=1 FL=1|nr:MAG: hypothetical protein E6Q97_24040 [Desulfurellales bacterium]
MMDEYDKSYWAKAVAELNEAGEQLRAAQERAAAARTNVAGFAQYLKEKYQFNDSVEITPDGEIVGKTAAE